MANMTCKRVDTKHINDPVYKVRCVGCLILTHDGKILLQQRDADSPTFPNYLATFGGHIEKNETPLQALLRELKEELGATVKPDEPIILATLSEPESNHTSLEFAYFWHDKHREIKGCFEGQPKYFKNILGPQNHPLVMNDVYWIINECEKRGLLR
jgi:8-oxo-dGTP diphosphatase